MHNRLQGTFSGPFAVDALAHPGHHGLRFGLRLIDCNNGPGPPTGFFLKPSAFLLLPFPNTTLAYDLRVRSLWRARLAAVYIVFRVSTLAAEAHGLWWLCLSLLDRNRHRGGNIRYTQRAGAWPRVSACNASFADWFHYGLCLPVRLP